MSELSMERSATSATAPRGVLGTLARARIARLTAGVDETTYPPMMTMTICMVKGTRDQKLFPAWIARLAGVSPTASPIRKTTATPSRAKTKGSGNQRSVQLAITSPHCARRPSDWRETAVRSAVMEHVLLAGFQSGALDDFDLGPGGSGHIGEVDTGPFGQRERPWLGQYRDALAAETIDGFGQGARGTPADMVDRVPLDWLSLTLLH